MCGLACPERYAGGAAECNSTEMLCIESSVIQKMFLDIRHVIKRVEVKVLIIGQDKDHIWPSSRLIIRRGLDEAFVLLEGKLLLLMR